MQPVAPAALQLAQRLRQLRQSVPQLTQEGLAKALGAEKSLAPATVSSWESLRVPKTPPASRIDAYGRFFCTARSVPPEGEPTLLSVDELTPDEKRAYEKLLAELGRLRSAAGGESFDEEPTFNRTWNFPDAGRITFVCAELPEHEIGPFGNPNNLNYTVLQRYADIDALMELHGHIRAENPTATVHFRTPDEVDSDDLTGHLVLLGGVVWNDMTRRLSAMAKLPVRQIEDPDLHTGEIFAVEVKGKEHKFVPQWMDEDKTVLASDVGLLARVPNPLSASRTLTICNGIHSRGVYGAVRTLTDAALRDGNERYIATNFGDGKSFSILMSVEVIKNQPITPDFNIPGTVLYTSPQGAA
jgi:hypothetical protein